MQMIVILANVFFTVNTAFMQISKKFFWNKVYTDKEMRVGILFVYSGKQFYLIQKETKKHNYWTGAGTDMVWDSSKPPWQHDYKEEQASGPEC